MNIKVIKTEEERKQYSGLCRYCFNDQAGWTDRIFGSRAKGETAYGAYEGNELKSAIMCKYFTVSLFGTLQEMAGISVVASYPEVRNQGYIRNLMKRALNDEHEKGTAVSALYPFNFGYYNKFGYGALAGFWNVSFNPYDIVPVKNASPLVPFDGTERMFGDIKKVREEYYTKFDLGAVPDPRDVSLFNDAMAFGKIKVYVAYDGNTPTGVLTYALKPSGPFASELEITTVSWTERKGLTDIMNHLASHRDQCSSIRGDFHPSVPFHLLAKEPRLATTINRSWMARPVNLEAVLNAKLTEGRSFEPVVFSIEDPVAETETATYRVTENAVEKTRFSGEHTVPLPLFSSLLFGGITAQQAFASVFPEPWILRAAAFFQKNRETYLNERF